jgi:YD repeat-containing protein
MEGNKKRGFRINIIDVVLVLLVILCIVGVFQRSNIQRIFSSGERLDTYTVTFEIRKLRSTAADLLIADTAFYLEEDGNYISLGALIGSPSVSAAVEYMYDENGNIVEAVYPEDQHEYLLDVTGKLSCRGVTEEGNFLLEGKTYLAVNQTLLAHTETADFEIRIVGIEKKA